MSGLVLVTGAAGRIGTMLRGGLPERGWALRCLDVVPIVETRPGEEHVVADVADLAAMVDATQGASAVVHLAGHVGEGTWPVISRAGIEGTYATLEAARRAGVQRVVLASSNHATGYTPRPDAGLLREADAPPRPDTYYGVWKVTMEALGSLYADRYGMDVVCLRIGTAIPEPTTCGTWPPGSRPTTPSRSSPRRCPPRLPASPWSGASRTTPATGGTSPPPAALGYEPKDDAEVYAEALIEAHGEPDPADPVLARVGGEFTLPEYDAEPGAGR